VKIIASYFGNHKKGCWKRLNQLLTSLAEDNNEITLILSHKPSAELHKNIKTICFNSKKENKLSLFSYLFLSLCVATFFITKSRYDRIIAFDTHNAFPFVFYKRVKKVPLFLFIRGIFKYQDLFKSKNFIISSSLNWANNQGYKIADRIRYVSKENKNEMIRIFGTHPKKSHIIKNNIRSAPSPINENTPNDGVFRIGYLGQLTKRKNISFLIKTLTLMKNKNVKLLIQGDGIEKKYLQDYAEKIGVAEQIEFMPWSRDVASFFKSIDSFVLSSFFDDSSNSLLEALSHKKICLASNRGGNKEILQYDENLLFCPINGHQFLANQLDTIIEDTDYREKISRKISTYKDSLIFNWEDTIKSSLLIK